MAWIKVFWMLVVMAASTRTSPLSDMKHVTLHVQSEILDGHKIVITLEPLGNDSKTDFPIEFQDSADVSVVTRGKSIQEQDPGKKSQNVTVEEDSTELPVPTVPGDEATNASSTAAPDVVIVSALPPEGGEDAFIVKFPNLMCPSGQKPDVNGKCRQMFGFTQNAGKSMDSFNFLFDGKGKSFAKKYWKKLGFE